MKPSAVPMDTVMHRRAVTSSVGASGATRARSWARVVAAVVATAVVFTSAPAPASAAQEVPEPLTPEQVEARDATLDMAVEQPPSPDDPFEAVVEADRVVEETALERLRTTKVADDAATVAFVATVERNEAQEVTDAAAASRDDAEALLERERIRLSRFTVHAYVTGGDAELEELGAILEGDTSDAAGGRAIMFIHVLQRQQEVVDFARAILQTARGRLRIAETLLAAATQEAADAAAASEAAAVQAASAAQAHDAAVGVAAESRSDLRRAAGGPIEIVPLELGIIGVPRLSAEDLATWFEGSAYRPRVSTPIEDFARWFIEEGDAEGIRGDVAFAQAVLETGGFANEDSVAANNFSGIGHCDSCDSGWVFPSPQMGVRAQIQLLKSYAVKRPEYVNALVDRRLRGPAGCCTTWGDLTTVWATDPGYGPKVMLIYSSMVQHALDRRAAGLG